MKLEIVGIHPCDRVDPINRGVISDEMVATSVGVTVRRVIYQYPETGITYVYLTNLPPAIASGIVAQLYKSRWDAEKVFDSSKTNSAKSNPGPAPRTRKPARPACCA